MARDRDRIPAKKDKARTLGDALVTNKAISGIPLSDIAGVRQAGHGGAPYALHVRTEDGEVLEKILLELQAIREVLEEREAS